MDLTCFKSNNYKSDFLTKTWYCFNVTDLQKEFFVGVFSFSAKCDNEDLRLGSF